MRFTGYFLCFFELRVYQLNNKKSVSDIFGGGRVAIGSGANQRYIRITSKSESQNFGVVFIVSSNDIIAVYISNNTHTSIFVANGDFVSITHSGLSTIFDLGNSYAHSFIILGGSLRDSKIEYLNNL